MKMDFYYFFKSFSTMETIFLFAFSALREFDMDVALTVINLFVSLYRDGLSLGGTPSSV